MRLLPQIACLRNEKQLSVLSFTLVFLNDAERDVKKFDMALRFGFLPCDVNPFGTVFFRNDVVFRQVCQVSPADACEYRKDKQVACVAQAVCGQFGIEQFFKLFPVQVAGGLQALSQSYVLQTGHVSVYASSTPAVSSCAAG